MRIRVSIIFLSMLLASTASQTSVISADNLEPQRYALVIGITGYPFYPPNQRLKFADRDAKAFAELIKSSVAGAFPEGNVKLVLNENATREGIFDGIKWLEERVRNQDTAFVFFAGHGAADRIQRAYFMPYEASYARPEAVGIRADEFLKRLREAVSPKHLIVFIDACHAGAALADGMTSRSGAGHVTTAIQDAWAKTFQNADGVNMALLSASANQESYEDDRLQHGIFTFYVLQGLRGAADNAPFHRGDGYVTMGELYRFVLDKVDAHARAMFRRQTPTKSPSFDPDFLLSSVNSPFTMASDVSKVPGHPTPLVHLASQSPGKLTGTVQNIYGSQLSEVQIRLLTIPTQDDAGSLTTADGHFEFDDVPAGDYEMRVEAHGFYPAHHRVTVGRGLDTAKVIVLRPRTDTESRIQIERNDRGGTLQGIVKSNDGWAIASVAVELDNVTGGRTVGWSNRDGTFYIGGLRAGRYQLRIALEGFRTVCGLVDISEFSGLKIEAHLSFGTDTLSCPAEG